MTFLDYLAAAAVTPGVGDTNGAIPGGGAKLSTLAIELPQAITPTIAGLVVGAFVGVVGFVIVLLVVGRPKRARRMTHAHAHAGASPDNVVLIPPYATVPRDTPVPQPFISPQMQMQARASYASAPAFAPQAYAAPVAPPAAWAPDPFAAPPQHPAHPRSMSFRPSTELSARAFAKMGYAVDADECGGALPPTHDDAFDAAPELSFDESELEPDEELAVERPVSVSPVLVLASERFDAAPSAASAQHPSTSRERQSSPHPLGIIKSSSHAMRVASPPSGVHAVPVASSVTSSSMRAASFADLDLDDSPTEIAETIFDEPPQPRRRSDPPRIRPIAPSPPRHASQTQARVSLPQVTPPVPRVRGH